MVGLREFLYDQVYGNPAIMKDFDRARNLLGPAVPGREKGPGAGPSSRGR